jgi:hypothetical protein
VFVQALKIAMHNMTLFIKDKTISDGGYQQQTSDL